MGAKTFAFKSWAAPTAEDDLESWHDGRCGRCGSANWGLVADHCHDNGLVRGLLCSGCNTREGVSYDPSWGPWREGDNTATLMRHFEIYKNVYGNPVISPQSAMTYYTTDEFVTFWQAAYDRLQAGEWPGDAPWIETAAAKREASFAHTRELMSRSSFGRGIAAHFATDSGKSA